MEMETIKYVGGPLNGQVADPGPGRWTTYRTDRGHYMRTDRGDRIFLQGQRKRSGYVLLPMTAGRIYVHASLAGLTTH